MRIGWLWVASEALVAFFYASHYGFASLVLECIISGVIGFLLAFKAGFYQLYSRVVFNGIGDIFSILGYGFGGILLFIPGLISDFFGTIIVIISLFIGTNSQANMQNQHSNLNQKDHNEDDIIDVEIIQEKDNK